MSTLLAINCGHTRMLQVRGDYPMSVIGRAMLESRPVEVVVFMPEFNEERLLVVDRLHLAKDGWGVRHIEGTILEDDGSIRAIFYDNPAEADPLNLK